MYLKPHNIAIILMAEIIQANAFSMGLCKLPQQEDKGTAAMMRPVSPSMKEMIGNYGWISVLE